MPSPLDMPQRATRALTKLRRDHPTSVAFLDESGAIAKDRYFGVGLFKCANPSRLLRDIQKYRDRLHWYKEFKYSDINAGSVEIFKGLVDVCLANSDNEFFCFIADRDEADPVERFGTTWDAYGKLAEQLVVAALHPDELTVVLADNYSTPDHILFEEQLRESVNRRLKRLAMVSCCRLDSKSSDGLQAVDLLTSAVALEFRAAANLASPTGPKAQVAKHVRGALGASSCLGGWRSGQHSVAMYQHGSWSAASS